MLWKLGLTLDQLNTAIYACSDLPDDVHIPPLKAKLTHDTKRGTPKSGATLCMTGSQVMHFAVHRCAPSWLCASVCVLTRFLLRFVLRSVSIFDPLLTDKMRQHPAWASWVKLVELFALTI